MECMEMKALKSSFASEKAMKSVVNQQQVIKDDIWYANVTGDEFIIDDFFDIPNNEDDNNSNNNNNSKKDGEFYLEEEQDGGGGDEEEEKYSNSCNSLSSSYDLVHDSAHFSAQLAIPDDDMQELELWSHFMDDSVPEPTLPCPNSSLDAYFKQTGFTIVNRVEPCTKQRIVSVSRFPTTVPVKKRSKRFRSTKNRSWFTSSHPKSPSSTLSWESTPSSARPIHGMGFCYGYTSGKPGNGGIGSIQRKCSHCQVTKTPQWRAGPNGPKTLCNACGVRFKSGRLFPEYRPACSPTFSSEVHSNSHRKVLEMRQKKDMIEAKPHIGST